MLTGSMAMNQYAMPRMTRDIDIVIELNSSNIDELPKAFPENRYYHSQDAAIGALEHFSCFNIIHLATMIKIDFMVRKNEEYRIHEFTRKILHNIQNHPTWIVSKEDLILSKLHWARDTDSELQFGDIRNLLSSEPCDKLYIQQWAEKLQLTATLTQATA